MKTCSNCKQNLEDSNFAWKIKNKRRQSCCKECIREKIRIHYHKNKSQYVKRARERDLKIRRFVYNHLINHPCVDCQEKDPILLEFDHLFDKSWSISQGVKKRQSIKRIAEEIDKCEVRCVKCHRYKTAKEQNWYSDL